MAEDAARREVGLASGPKSGGRLKLDLPRAGGLPPLDIQQLWFAILHWDWSSLALVPADSKGSVVWIAKALAQVGNLQRGGRAPRIKTEGTSPASTLEREEFTGQFTIQSMNSGLERSKNWTIIALDPVLTHPAGIALALGADAALLCVELGKSDIAEAKRTVQLIGHDRFRGCLIIK